VAAVSGNRMFNQFYIYQQRLMKKRIEREKDLLKEVRDRPAICKKSESILRRAES
jgi:hypothetical protein